MFWGKGHIKLRTRNYLTYGTVTLTRILAARPWPSSVKILTLLGHGRAVSKFFFQILTLLGRGRAVSKFFFKFWHCSAVAVVAHTHARARACLRLLSYEIAARARAFTQWPSAMAVSREVKVTTRALCAHCPSLNFVVCQRLSETVFDDTYITCNWSVPTNPSLHILGELLAETRANLHVQILPTFWSQSCIPCSFLSFYSIQTGFLPQESSKKSLGSHCKRLKD